jgi:hypothetical protein
MIQRWPTTQPSGSRKVCAFTLRVVRDGAVVASQGPSQSARIELVPQQGDVAQLYTATEKGEELVSAVTFDGRPTLDDISCAVVGRTGVSGQLGAGVPSIARIRDGQATETAVSASGDRFTAAFGAPVGIGDTLTATGRQTTTKSGTFPGEDVSANVTALMSAQVCPIVDVNKGPRRERGPERAKAPGSERCCAGTPSS